LIKFNALILSHTTVITQNNANQLSTMLSLKQLYRGRS